MAKSFLEKMYTDAETLSRRNIDSSLSSFKPNGVLLDVGCWDGHYTKRWAKAVKAKKVLGIELVEEAAQKAKKMGFEVYSQDLNKEKWKIKDESIDYVVSNLVVEHLSDMDHFIEESFRVLKKGGYTVVSTNNISSWHNILSLILGWAPFDMVVSSKKKWAIGNPLALHSNELPGYGPTFTHKCVYNIRWLKEWYQVYGFIHRKTLGAGYYPLPAFLGNIDKTHSAFMTLSFQKPL